MVMPAATYFTAQMVRSLPEDGHRYEVVHGELLVTPAPRAWHQELVARLADALRSYLRRQPAGHLFVAPADISWDAGSLVQPDLFMVPLEQARTLDWTRMQELVLVAEVLSPSTARADRFTKRRRYQEAGVPLYWVVDGDFRQAEVWTPGDLFPRIEREALTWQPEGITEPFQVELVEVFRPI